MADRTDSLSLRADRTRHHLSELVDNLQDQMAPAQLVNQLVGYGGPNRGSGMAETIATQASRNPLACLLIAAGVGWLMWSDRVATKPKARRRRAVARRRSAAGKRRRRRTAASAG